MHRLILSPPLRSLLRPLHRTTAKLNNARALTISSTLQKKNFPPLPPILDAEITENFLRGTGPGGQKINKTSSAVQLLHHPTGIVVKCQETRSRSQNRKIARRLLALKLEERELGEGARTAIRAERERKKKGSKVKKARRKYKKLAEGKAGEEGAAGEEDGGEDDAAEEEEDADVVEGEEDTVIRSEHNPETSEQTDLRKGG